MMRSIKIAITYSKSIENNVMKYRLKRIGDLIKAVQTNNVKNDSIKTPSDTLEDETDKIMRSIIRPEVERKDDKK